MYLNYHITDHNCSDGPETENLDPELDSALASVSMILIITSLH
jgi:hypothetical protein